MTEPVSRFKKGDRVVCIATFLGSVPEGRGGFVVEILSHRESNGVTTRVKFDGDIQPRYMRDVDMIEAEGYELVLATRGIRDD